MDEHSASALQYGHLGRATYDPETQAWEFSRRLSQPPHISYGGVTQTTIPSPLTAPQSSHVENKSALRKAYPELAACWPLLQNETLSHVIATTTELCDPLVTSLFDLGYAVDLQNDSKGTRAIPIAVVASGECGNSISFRRFEEVTVELKQGSTAGMRVPSIGKLDSTEWSAGGAPARQICFAHSLEEKATWVAARFPNFTLIFRPLYHRYPVPVHLYRQGERVVLGQHSNARLNANPQVEISYRQTGGFPHADVTFNPWYQRQFALVDERGNWSIWELIGRQKRHKGKVSADRVKSGSLPWLDLGDGQDIEGHPRHDGWAAIEWAGNFNTFIVSDRRCPILYLTENDETYSYPIELDLSRKSEWILDVKRSPCNPVHVFILTTSRVFWLDVGPDALPAPGGDSSPSLYPRLSWRHFRDPEDITLKLTPLLLDKDFYLVLYSRLNTLALSYYCSPPSESTLSIPDPFILDISSISDDNTEASPESTRFSTLVFREIGHSPASVGKGAYNPDTRVVKLFTMDSHLRVRESLFTGPSKEYTEDDELGKDILRVKRRHTGVHKEQHVQTEDNFVVDDWDDSVVGASIFTASNTGMSNIAPLAIPQFTIDFTQVYAVATGRTIVAPEGEGAQLYDRSLQESIKMLQNKVSNLDLSAQPVGQTLHEFLGSSPLLDDIDQNAQELSEFLSRMMADCSSGQFFVQAPAVSGDRPVSGPPSTTGVNLVGLYDRLANDWLSNLPHNIPGRTRIMKEKVIRNIAADLVLSQVTILRRTIHAGEAGATGLPIQFTNTSNNDETTDANEIWSGGLSLLPNTPSEHNMDVVNSSAAARSDSRWAEDGISEKQDTPVPLFSSLSSFTEFDGDRSMPQSVMDMLEQWQPGTDADMYNWQRIGHTSEADEMGQLSRPTTPKRSLRRKTSQGANLDSSAPPPVFSATPVVRDWGSQLDTDRFTLRQLPSSQLVDEDLPMTQVERGTFGGREAARKNAAKARKKRRAAGF
ncbi:RNA polymerase I-specific transcription initiation factor RRN6-like protein [Aspergillus ambiguus]|uniref:uncharacterized protein n=1 Tax=Aspergillus ambiguus TaxID=176160 RepID=UPI003CCE16EC